MVSSKKSWLLRISVLAVVLVFCVVMLGAWTRLRDAGLGCPDWPTCYGMLTVPTQAHDVARANDLYPEQPVEANKAWPETIHRYFASSLGALILSLAAIAFAGRREPDMPLKQVFFLLVLVCVQGAFGAWTVTMKLFPPVVTTHLLLGFTTFTALTLLALRAGNYFPASNFLAEKNIRGLQCVAMTAFVFLAVQIALGGWTASNYAAAVCTGLPICQQGWVQQLNFSSAFQFFGHDAPTYQYAPHLLADAKITIHVLHRIGAMLTSAVILGLIFALWLRAKSFRYRAFAAVLFLALCVQVALGVSNIIFQLPLSVAVAHNAVAAILLQIMAALIFSLYRERVA